MLIKSAIATALVVVVSGVFAAHAAPTMNCGKRYTDVQGTTMNGTPIVWPGAAYRSP